MQCAPSTEFTSTYAESNPRLAPAPQCRHRGRRRGLFSVLLALGMGAVWPLAIAGASPPAAPAVIPPNDSDFWRLLQLLQMLLQVLDGPATPTNEPEDLFAAITLKYEADGVPGDLTVQERADALSWIAEIKSLLTALEGDLDPLKTAAFRLVLEAIRSDLGGAVRAGASETGRENLES